MNPNGPVYVHTTAYKHFTSIMPAGGGGGTYSTPVPIRSASLKSLWVCPRRSTESGNPQAFSISSRANPQIQSYFFRIGSMLYPNKAVQLQGPNSTGGYAEGLAEVKKALHSLNNTTHGTILSSTNYLVGDIADAAVGTGTVLTAIATGANSSSNGFLIGQELEVFPQKNDVILSGLNTTDNQQTYLKLTVKNNDTVALALDGSAMCFINRIDIYSGSNLIESIQQYNVMTSMILDTNINSSNRNGHSCMYGTEAAVTSRKGCSIAANGNIQSFCIPLISGVVGSLSEKMLNLNLDDDIRIEIVLENDNIAVCYATAPTVNRWEIVNAELQCQIIELGDEGMQIVNSTMNSNGPVYVHTTAYKHFTSTLPA
eukprot:gene17986-25175_t